MPQRFSDSIALSEELTRRLSTLLKWSAQLLSTVGLGYCTLLAVYWILAPMVGESNPAIAVLLLLPPLIWGLPLALLFAPCLIFARRTALVIAVTSILHLVAFMDFEYNAAPASGNSPNPDSLTILSYNRGQHNNASLQPFKNLISPDIIALQDARHRAANYRKAQNYSEFPHIDQQGEFVLLSKFPITSSTELPLSAKPATGTPNPPPAARFVIDFNGRQVAIYVTHFLTPRDWVSSVKRGGFLYGLIGIPGTTWGEKRKAYSKFWQSQHSAARALADRTRSDDLPTIVAGDMNVADTGAIYRTLTKNLSDAHEQAGRGYGFTFPGKTNNPAALFQPWLRLDYILADTHWRATNFQTEKNRPSQHRAVAATFKFLGSSPTQ